MANVKLSIMCFIAQSHIDGPDYSGALKKWESTTKDPTFQKVQEEK
jgi:hypothetical protein